MQKRKKINKKLKAKKKITSSKGLPIDYAFHKESSFPYYDPGIGPDGEVVW